MITTLAVLIERCLPPFISGFAYGYAYETNLTDKTERNLLMDAVTFTSFAVCTDNPLMSAAMTLTGRYVENYTEKYFKDFKIDGMHAVPGKFAASLIRNASSNAFNTSDTAIGLIGFSIIDTLFFVNGAMWGFSYSLYYNRDHAQQQHPQQYHNHEYNFQQQQHNIPGKSVGEQHPNRQLPGM